MNISNAEALTLYHASVDQLTLFENIAFEAEQEHGEDSEQATDARAELGRMQDKTAPIRERLDAITFWMKGRSAS